MILIGIKLASGTDSTQKPCMFYSLPSPHVDPVLTDMTSAPIPYQRAVAMFRSGVLMTCTLNSSMERPSSQARRLFSMCESRALAQCMQR